MKKILFNDRYGLTEAVLSGRKTQTRRIIKLDSLEVYSASKAYGDPEWSIIAQYAKYKVGEVVAVAQSYHSFYNDECDPRIFPNGAGWTNKMFVRADLMPHQIRITDVRVERLQDISDEDSMAEGVYILDEDPMNPQAYIYTFPNSPEAYYHPREAYAALIDRISGKGTWQSNPYVFVYEFELIK